VLAFGVNSTLQPSPSPKSLSSRNFQFLLCRLHSSRGLLLRHSPYAFTPLLPHVLGCHRDRKHVTLSSLDSALAKRDACKSFRMRIYENCRVSLGSTSLLFKNHFNSQESSLLRGTGTAENPSSVFNRLRTLPFSVCRKAFACHFDEECAVVNLFL
jgi:hypothetical protein